VIVRRRLLWAVIGAVVLSTLVLGTGGFTAASIDRPVAVTVSDHDRSLVTLWDPGAGGEGQPPRRIASAGLNGEDPVTSDGQTTRVVAVQNRFSDRAITVDATVAESPPGVGVGPFDSVDLGPGDAGALNAPVDCGDRHGPVEVTLEVTASDEHFTGVISYEATVVCATPDPTPTPTPDEASTTTAAASG
jgi:hypothetical protein